MGDDRELVRALLVAVVAAGTAGTLLSPTPGGARAAKMAASTAFVALAVGTGALEGGFGRFVLAGLVLSWVGDLALSYSGSRAFLGGLAAFLLAHVAYVAAFALRGVATGAMFVTAIVMLVFAVGLLRWLLPHVAAEMRVPVTAYAAAISAMVAAAGGTHGAESAPLILVAAVLFTLSDVGVARDRFVAPGPINRVVGLPMYYAAQTLLALAAGG